MLLLSCIHWVKDPSTLPSWYRCPQISTGWETALWYCYSFINPSIFFFFFFLSLWFYIINFIKKQLNNFFLKDNRKKLIWAPFPIMSKILSLKKFPILRQIRKITIITLSLSMAIAVTWQAQNLWEQLFLSPDQS